MLKKLIASSFLALSLTLVAEEEPAAEEKQPLDIEQVSKAFGHLIGNNLSSLEFEFEMDKVMQGIKDAMAGLDSPLSETETVQAISLVQEDAFQKQATKNLDEATTFLDENAKAEDIVVAEEGKLHYHVDKVGKGEEVQPHSSPLIKYTGKFLDGKVFGSSEENERINLDETIAGFTKGIVGMKEGEKRTLYIHPDLGYGTAGFLPPNSLLTFEIELVQANSLEEGEALTSIHELDENNSDIASPNTDDVTPVR